MTAAKRLLIPFDVMRATRALAPHDARLNDIRWLTGEALRRVDDRAARGDLRAADPSAAGGADTARKARVDPAAAKLLARQRLALCENRAGPAAWPILTRIVLQGSGVRECRDLVPEIVSPWRADAVIADRLRVALDAIGPLLGGT
jgi:hypothetical protein